MKLVCKNSLYLCCCYIWIWTFCDAGLYLGLSQYRSDSVPPNKRNKHQNGIVFCFIYQTGLVSQAGLVYGIGRPSVCLICSFVVFGVHVKLRKFRKCVPIESESVQTFSRILSKNGSGDMLGRNASQYTLLNQLLRYECSKSPRIIHVHWVLLVRYVQY